ncbi:uncharacterized protein LOC132723885 isoform X2 [Ruditapes philippinarum]|uniref:uncharacterized protein LOC132723885 isoform X2 n=1 Tax=Ruditapes philippinarum TaxID=129788 RepID=UPI00295BA143|nr:uncharacterized protein LOC132723885 isoform X2 [Ruditapes philippinarum]
MDSSVSIFYVSDGYNWSDYLFKKLHSKEYEITCEQIQFNKRSEHSLQSSVLNVFFVTPDFLENQDWKWANSVDTNKCILVLTGTEQEDLEESAKHYKFDHVNDFFIFQLKETEDSVRDLLIFIITKYEDNDPHQSGVMSESPQSQHSPHLHHIGSEPRDFRYHERLSLKSNERLSEDDGNYDKLPNLQRQVNGLRDVIYKDGKLYFLLWRQAEGSLKVKLGNKELLPDDTHCAVYELEYEGKKSTNVSVIQDGTMIGEQLVQISSATDRMESSVFESTNISKAPARAVGISIATQTDELDVKDGRTVISKSHEKSRASLYVNIDDVSREDHAFPEMSRTNKLEYIRKILADETDPEEMLCQCLGINKGVKHLDEKMTSMVQCVETLRHLSFSGTEKTSHENKSSAWPTLVHFGAQFNLTSFCEALLCNPLMYGACVTTNKDGHMPHDIARIHGHTELADMLKHFSEFVKAEKERDSGISVPPGYPRLSTIIGDNPPPPAPHPRHYSDSNYIDMSVGNIRSEFNEKGDGKLRQHSLKKPRENSHDGGFCGSVEVSSDDDEYLPMSPKMSPLAAENYKKSDLMSSRNSSSSSLMSKRSFDLDPERRTLLGTDDETDIHVEHHRKDVVHMLGMAEPPVSPEEHKKPKKNSKLKKLFFGKKNRSLSEPSILSNEAISVKRNLSAKSYYRDSARSSSSTASTYSDTSMKEDDGSEVQLREDKKGGIKIKGFLKKAKKRQSLRVKQAMADNQINLPALPPRSEVFSGRSKAFSEQNEMF